MSAAGPAPTGAPGTGPVGAGGLVEGVEGEPPYGRFFLPGPTEVRPEVLAAMTRPVIGHRGAAMRQLLGEMAEGLSGLFRTVRPVFLSTSSASGLMEAAITNLTRRRVLCLTCGAFGERFGQIAEACGRPADLLEAEWGSPSLPERLAGTLARRPGRYDLVTVVHSETSTGVLSPVAEIARVVREQEDVLLAVDAVSSVAGAPLEFDAWGLDLALAGSQKALALPPGIALGVASERALRRAAEVPARGYYFDLLDLERRARERQTTNTPAVSLLFALAFQLERIAREGLETRWERHARMAERTAGWTQALAERTGRPYGVLGPTGYRSPTVTAIRLPEEVRASEVVGALSGRGWTIGAGYGKLKEATIRIGHMGDHTEAELERLLAELGAVLQGHRA